LLSNERPPLSSGRRPADWVYVDDVVRGLLRVATAPDIEGRTVDLGSGTLVPVRDVVLQLADIIRSDVEVTFGDLPDRPFEQVRCADLADTRARIGWEPEVSLSEGLKRTVAWYAERS
jgi:nucleoside-diphosphate-sugar epimerase